MDENKLRHFRELLTAELRRRTDRVREDQANALSAIDDSVKDTGDMSVQDVNQETALRMGERESQMVADIDQALLRIEEGTYGICQRCGKQIDERRLEAVPTARYDAECQALIEKSEGKDENPTL
jgi:DnaK suppressor protein